MAEAVSDKEDFVAQILQPDAISIDCSLLSRGIDNYLVDVRLSEPFIRECSEMVHGIVKRVTHGSRPTTSSTEGLNSFLSTYVDMIKTTLHRAKSNLEPAAIQFLQFGVIKFILQEVREQLDISVKHLEDTLAQQQFSGSRELLPTQEKLAWFRRHYNRFLFLSNRAVFQLLQREENGMRDLREQLLGQDFSELINMMFNPMLASASPTDPYLLVECYGLWPKGGAGFSEANLVLEKRLGSLMPQFDITPLKSGAPSSGQPEIYDVFQGFFSSRDILGPAENQRDNVHEQFCWLDRPGNIDQLFDLSVHEKFLLQVDGLINKWRLGSYLKKFRKIASVIRKKMFTNVEIKEALVAYLLRGKWTTDDQDIIDLPIACSYVAGNNSKKILSRIDQSRAGSKQLLKRLNDLVDVVNKQLKAAGDGHFLRLLTDFCRYRLHLKYFRFAHRILNRINVISEPHEIQLARAGGSLYELLGFEANQDLEVCEPEIERYTIIKADVRGSTKVTAELIKKDLNPASYFSLRFFNPINELLGTYGATKLFIEGDAIILGIYENSNEPEQWYCVSRACGVAKDILDIVYSKNSHSKQTGLPTLEIGIGISYADKKPLFLFDEDKPIMISSAIGEADRLSSCSWRLRDTFNNGLFNVEVLEIAEGTMQRGEKGQDFIRYNVNGVLLHNSGFKKLQEEITLKKLRIKCAEGTEVMYVGKFPDVREKERELVIREGKVGHWSGEELTGAETDHVFYEIMPNSKLTSQVLELYRRQA